MLCTLLDNYGTRVHSNNDHGTLIMSRNCTFPSTAQVERILECLEERRYLATGYARTSHARDRTRAAWQDVALKLNSDGSGCTKTWQQWAKYWKDKKAAVKNKSSRIRMARQRTGGGQSNNISLTVIEEKIVALMGGEAFACGDRELEINPFNPPAVDPPHQMNGPAQPEPFIILPPAVTPPHQMNIPDEAESQNVTPGSESILRDEQQVGQSIEGGAQMEYQHIGKSLDEAAATPYGIATPSAAAIQSAVPHRSAHVASASPRRRPVATGRRSGVQRTPPAQRHSQMASLTQRFIAIEEKPLENEARIIDNKKKMCEFFMDNQKKMHESFSDIIKAMTNQTKAIDELFKATRALAENKK